MKSQIEGFKSKCYICGKTVVPTEDSYVMLAVLHDCSTDYDPVRKAYRKHYLERECNMCVPCYLKVINFIEEEKE